MEQMEDLLKDSLRKGKLNIVKISSCVLEDSNKFTNVLFNSVQKIIEDFPKTSNLYNIDYLFDYLDYLKESNLLDIEDFKKKITKLNKRIEYIKREKLKNRKKDKNNLSSFQEELYSYKSYICNPDDIESDFINYLIEKPRELSYIDLVFEKMPEVTKIKDKTGISLYNNIINKYLKSIDNSNQEELAYYKNLLLLLTTKNNIVIKENDKKKNLHNVYNKINKLTVDKQSTKQNKEKIELLNELKNIIVKTESKDKDIYTLASKYNISIDFSPNITNFLINHNYQINKEKYPDRKYIKDYVLSIDGENSIEIDDALSCIKLKNGNYLLGVHIASILGYFDYDSDIVQNAFNRVHSIYLHNKSLKENSMIPIFPLEFSAKEGSLIEGQERLTRTYLFEIDNKGRVLHQEFFKSIIRNDKQATYQEINNIIDNGSSNKELNNTVNNLKEVIDLIRDNYSTSEVYEMIKESSSDSSDLKVKRVGSEQIVYQSMLLTGNKVAEYFANNNYPCLYRVHKVPKKVNDKIESLINSLVDNYGGDQKEKLYQLVNEIYPKSTYDLKGKHSGLKLNHYCHCTSGLRRSADILVEYALEVCHDKNPTKDEIENLQEELLKKKELIVSKEDTIDLFVKEVNKTYSLRKH